MATRKAVQVDTTEPSDEEVQQAMALLQDDSFNGESINPALESLYAELGMGEAGEATVHVTLLDSDNRGKEAIIWRGNPEDYDLERLAKQFGSGDYRVKVYVRISSGHKVMKGNKIFTWKLTPEEERKRLNPATESAPAPQINMMDIARLISEGIRAAMPAPAPVVDQFAQLKGMAEIMQMMRPPEPTYQPQAQPVNQLGMIRDVAELLQTLKGDSDEPAARGANGNDLIMTVISKFAPLLTGVLAQQPAPQLMNGVPPAQPYPELQPPAQSQPQPAPPTQEDEMSIKLRMGLSWMIGQCDGGGMPETYAEVVLDSVPQEAVNALLNSPAPLDYLAQFEPRVKTEPYLTWFGNLIKACREMSNPEVNNETPS